MLCFEQGDKKMPNKRRKNAGNEIKYTLMHDLMFKMLFTRNPELLKRLVSSLLGISFDSIQDFVIVGGELPPSAPDKKFCRLDMNMKVDGQMVNIEVQVKDGGDYRRRSMFYWAKIFGGALVQGENYGELPPTVVITILDFALFKCKEFHSRFCALEMGRHELLCDCMDLHFFELCKLPAEIDPDNEPLLWLKLFCAKTKEEFDLLKKIGGPIMRQVIQEREMISSEPGFLTMADRLDIARFTDASALQNANKKGRKKGREEEREKWQGVLAGKDMEWQSLLASNKAEIADKDAEIERLKAQLKAGSGG